MESAVWGLSQQRLPSVIPISRASQILIEDEMHFGSEDRQYQ